MLLWYGRVVIIKRKYYQYKHIIYLGKLVVKLNEKL